MHMCSCGVCVVCILLSFVDKLEEAFKKVRLVVVHAVGHAFIPNSFFTIKIITIFNVFVQSVLSYL